MNFVDFKRIQSRRDFFKKCAGGLGTIGLWHLLALDGVTARASETQPHGISLNPELPNFVPKAKNVIFLFMAGAPSHIDLFDPSPE